MMIILITLIDDLTRLQMIVMVFMLINSPPVGTQRILPQMTTMLCLLRRKALLVDDNHGDRNDNCDHFDDHDHQRYDNHHSPVGTQRILQPMTTKLCLLRRKIHLLQWECRSLKGICQGITHYIPRSY